MYNLSLLDKSPVAEGDSPSIALSNTIQIATLAEKLGYERIWVAEHPGSNELACSAPEIIISWILANTSRIQVGSGGVMLQHYAPYKVAEVFNVLSSLAPGRVDLGVGKTPGGLPYSTAALQAYRSSKPDFEQQLSELSALLDQGHGHVSERSSPYAGPKPDQGPRRYVLSASPQSASLAASHGWDFVFAGHLNGDAENMRTSLATFREQSGGRSAILGLAALVSDTQAKAAELASQLKVFVVKLKNGTTQLVGSPERGAEFARQSGTTEYTLEERRPTLLHGTAETVHQELAYLAREHHINEFMIDTPAVGHALRQRSIELLADSRPRPASQQY
ncbi:MsnO8 family LLM class oxidoreductase [Xylophilus sp.]|uniref:MsnO8 family LLM class oxidoreductase n=1 Tax=Xylophilus sp. TaxID=2653893 RepID=UPI002D7F4F91|nr:MsnO8 family LLM class oxidoreductase [Xylophilus sp.]